MTKSFITILLAFSISFANDKVEKAGDYLEIIIPSFAFLTTIFKDDIQGSKEFLYSSSATFVTTKGLKSAVDSERPNHLDKNSFPSGHTSITFQSAAFLHKRYGFFTALPAYIGGSFVGYSRVESHQHHITDVLAGAIIGSGFSYIFTTSYKRDGFVYEPTVFLEDRTMMYGVKITW